MKKILGLLILCFSLLAADIASSGFLLSQYCLAHLVQLISSAITISTILGTGLVYSMAGLTTSEQEDMKRFYLTKKEIQLFATTCMLGIINLAMYLIYY